MASEEKLMFYAPDEENLKILENLGLRYKEMVDHYERCQSTNTIKYYLKKFGIHHNTKKEMIRKYLENDPFHSSKQVAIHYGVSARLVNMVKAEMPKITYIKSWYDGEDNNDFHCVIQGHSGYAPKGADIVCAAISSISQFVINTVAEWKPDIKAEVRNGYIEFSYHIGNEYEYYINSSMIKHFLELQNQYPDNVKIVI